MGNVVRRLAPAQVEPRLDIAASEAVETIVGLGLVASPDVRCDAYDVGCPWFDRVRSSLSAELSEMAGAFESWEASHALWHALIAAVAEGPTTLADLLAHLEAMPADEFWLQAAGYHARHEPSEELREATLSAGRGSPEPLERLLASDPHAGHRWPRALPGALGGDAGAARRRIVELLSSWHREVFAPEWAGIAAIVERDADEKRQLARAASVSAVVEEATNGGVYVPEAGIGRLLLVPTYLGRPWVIQGRQRGTLVMVYPAGEAAITGSPDEARRRRVLRLAKALSDDTRLRALRRLAESSRSLVELADELGVSKSTMHHHLAALRSAGLLRWEGSHRDKRYSLRSSPLNGMSGLLGEYLSTVHARTSSRRRRG